MLPVVTVSKLHGGNDEGKQVRILTIGIILLRLELSLAMWNITDHSLAENRACVGIKGNEEKGAINAHLCDTLDTSTESS